MEIDGKVKEKVDHTHEHKGGIRFIVREEND